MACLFLWFLVPCYDTSLRLRSIPYSNAESYIVARRAMTLYQCGTILYTKAESYIAARQAMTLYQGGKVYCGKTGDDL